MATGCDGVSFFIYVIINEDVINISTQILLYSPTKLLTSLPITAHPGTSFGSYIKEG